MPLKHTLRIYVLKLLVPARAMRWRDIQDKLDVTTGNLGTALKLLVKDGYIQKAIVGNKEVVYEITKRGVEAYRSYSEELRT